MKSSPPLLLPIVVGLLLATGCVQPGLSRAALDLQARRVAARDARVALEHFSTESAESALAPNEPPVSTPRGIDPPSAETDEVLPAQLEPQRARNEEHATPATKDRRESTRNKRRQHFTLRGYVLSSTTEPASNATEPLVVFARRESDDRSSARAAEFAKLSLPPLHQDRDQGRERATTGFAVSSAGSGVRLTNVDDICHAFFSSSGPNAFDSAVLNPGESREIAFEEAGIVHIYCTLHEGKQASVLVVPTPYHATVAEDGSFSIPHVAPGEYMLSTWSSSLPTRRRRVKVTSEQPQPILIDLKLEHSGGTE